ncbi:hypothetical protein GOODEAATRI_029763 [Goodea atripinnis]|uniref:Secreted protein n=1 Tax=Goodea atripinnis TaxID=208336 RepID=A0ABV0N5E7_9TELE
MNLFSLALVLPFVAPDVPVVFFLKLEPFSNQNFFMFLVEHLMLPLVSKDKCQNLSLFGIISHYAWTTSDKLLATWRYCFLLIRRTLTFIGLKCVLQKEGCELDPCVVLQGFVGVRLRDGLRSSE